MTRRKNVEIGKESRWGGMFFDDQLVIYGFNNY